MQRLFTRNPSQRQSSRTSLEYLLLPPISAPTSAPGRLTPSLLLTPLRPSYSSGLHEVRSLPRGVRHDNSPLAADGGVLARGFGAINFQCQLLRQVSCYTLLSGFRFPWTPSCCLQQPTDFMVSHKRRLKRLNSTFGSSHSASTAYQNWPTWHSDSKKYHVVSCSKQARDLTHLKFENV